MKNNPIMQTFVDSLCQCFGTNDQQRCDIETFDANHQTATVTPGVSEALDMKRRTKSLGLQDGQWDALFNPSKSVKPNRSRSAIIHNQAPRDGSCVSMTQAQAVAKSKMMATAQKERRTNMYKRKRNASRDDIFRSKQNPSRNGNVLSRFLSNNPVIMNSLCFATPVRGSDEVMEMASVVSDTNTLNTAEDTITSTLYYEKTKLAGLKQKSPPMPLFNSHTVKEADDIHQIVVSHSHSSVKLLTIYDMNETIELEDEDSPPASPRREDVLSGDDIPPPMTNLSTDSSRSGARSANSLLAASAMASQ